MNVVGKGVCYSVASGRESRKTHNGAYKQDEAIALIYHTPHITACVERQTSISHHRAIMSRREVWGRIVAYLINNIKQISSYFEIVVMSVHNRHDS
jgi:hypothetical protein